jgi:glycosyltransferase involved in cell wall biosynthesis
MKILYLSQFLATTGGGGDVVFSDLAKSMINRGHEVHIICHRMNNPGANDIPGAKVHKINPMINDKAGYFLSMSEHAMYVANALIKGSSIVRKNKIDVIHANTITPVIPATILGKIYRIPVIATVHVVYTGNLPNYWRQWSSQEKISRTASTFAPFYEKLVLKFPATIIHTVSNFTRDALINLKPNSPLVVIPNGMDLAEYNFHNIKVTYEGFILFIARLVFNKNLNTVIESFAKVVEKIPSAKLIVVGDGPMRKEWEKMVIGLNLSQNIIFVGFISQEKKMTLLSKCSALVLPSFVEGFALTPLEAFAMGKPVLLSNIPPSHELVDDGVDGFILPPHDPSKWSEKIFLILSNRQLAEKMGQCARRKMEEKFDIALIHDKIQQLYIDVAKKKTNISG